jgi:hypothetical protein
MMVFSSEQMKRLWLAIVMASFAYTAEAQTVEEAAANAEAARINALPLEQAFLEVRAGSDVPPPRALLLGREKISGGFELPDRP